MSASRHAGMDHDHYAYSPLPSRPPLRWPNGASVAVCPILSLEYLETPAPAGSVLPRDLGGGLGLRAEPNYPMLAHREYGHRVGIFRLLDVLAERGIRPTVAVDGMTASRYPRLIEHLRTRDCDVLAHGLSLNRMLSSRMSEGEEKGVIEESLGRLIDAGVPARGWLSPEYGESPRTPQMLAAAGMEYLCDWLNDEQPYPMVGGSLVALPLMCDYDDSYALWKRQLTLDSYLRILTKGFDRLSLDGRTSARVMAFQLRPWLTGQPHRVWVLEQLLDHVRSDGDAWLGTAGEIVDAYIAAGSAG